MNDGREHHYVTFDYIHSSYNENKRQGKTTQRHIFYSFLTFLAQQCVSMTADPMDVTELTKYLSTEDRSV